MGEARKDRQLRMDAVLLEIFLQALHTGYAVIAIRGVADKLVVELADTDEDGYLLYGFEVDIITEVILEITDTPEVVLVWIQEGRTARCTDGAGLQTIRVSEQEAVYELPATRVSEHEKLICVNAWIALRHILDHIEENQIIADAVAGEELIAVEVIALNESTREHRRKHSHMIFVGEFLRLLDVLFDCTAGSMDDDEERVLMLLFVVVVVWEMHPVVETRVGRTVPEHI